MWATTTVTATTRCLLLIPFRWIMIWSWWCQCSRRWRTSNRPGSNRSNIGWYPLIPQILCIVFAAAICSKTLLTEKTSIISYVSTKKKFEKKILFYLLLVVPMWPVQSLNYYRRILDHSRYLHNLCMLKIPKKRTELKKLYPSKMPKKGQYTHLKVNV